MLSAVNPASVFMERPLGIFSKKENRLIEQRKD